MIDEKDKGKAPMVEEEPTPQPPNKLHVFERRKSTVKKQQTISTATQLEDSRASSPTPKLLSLPPPRSDASQIVELDSPPREYPPLRPHSPKRRKVEATRLVDYSTDFDDEIIVTKDEMTQGIPSPPREMIPQATSLILRKVDQSGLNNVDDIREKAYNEFIDDESFVKTKTFQEFVWRAIKDEDDESIKIGIINIPELPRGVIECRVFVEMKEKY